MDAAARTADHGACDAKLSDDTLIRGDTEDASVGRDDINGEGQAIVA